MNDRREIVFHNGACGDLLGLEPGQLVGQRCDYRAAGTAVTLADVAASLCPPAEVFSGAARTTDMQLLSTTGQLFRRRVTFQPLGPGGADCGGVLAFVGDLATASDSRSEAAELHARLWTLRRGVLADCQVDELVGVSSAIQRVRDQIELASRGPGRVLVCGPAGSGREHVARLLHDRLSPESFKPLIPLCCPLLDAELLQGTITALVRQVELADTEHPCSPRAGPTLLLLEVDQLGEQAQAELAGFLALPGFELYSVATSECSLLTLAEQGAFRTDLAYALSTLTITLPPLAKRPEDIPLLCQHFLEAFNAEGGRQLSGFSSEALDELAGYGWPDNVDQLSEIIELACRQAEGPVVDVRDLPQQIHAAVSADAHPRREDEPIDLDDFLAGIERELIVRALKRGKGNKTRAARLLGVNRARFHRRLEYFGIS
ncbi:MAG: helix-turn-helix domain-containing protein [Planctomycetota bacterium]